MIRILAGTCVRTDPEVLAAHLQTMRWQHAPNATVDLVYIDDNDDAESSELLRSEATRTLPAGERDEAATYEVGERTHEWSIPAFYRLAREKQRLLDLAIEEGYDYVWLVDSDLLCAPDTLTSLLESKRDVVSAVFWTRWQPEDPMLPQVWVRHPYGFDGAGWSSEEFLDALRSHQLVQVRGLGACTLIRTSALKHGNGFWPLLDDLPAGGMWQGEDRHFCVRAEKLHTKLHADAWPEVWHAYRPSDRARISEVLKHLSRKAPKKRVESTLVSCTIEPLEDMRLYSHVEHVRGALGSLRLLPELKDAAMTLRAGDAKIVRATFPNGEKRTLRIKLVSYRDARALGE